MSNSTQWTDLTAFQRDLLEVILDTASRDDPRSGQEIKVDLEAHREETVNHGRLYPNLDTLEAHGLIEVEKIDERTNGNRPTEAAVELYTEYDTRTSRIAAQYDNESERSALVADGGEDRPEWLPDEYDTDADLRERLPIMAEIDGGIELHATDDRGVREVLGSPHELTENHAGTYVLKCGGTEFNWSYEVAVTPDGECIIRSVDPDQPMEDYMDSKERVLDDGVDIRIWGVDVDREAAEADLGVPV